MKCNHHKTRWQKINLWLSFNLTCRPQDAVNKCFDWLMIYKIPACIKPEAVFGANQSYWWEAMSSGSMSGFLWLPCHLNLRKYWTLDIQILFTLHPPLQYKCICFPDCGLLCVWSENHVTDLFPTHYTTSCMRLHDHNDY